MEFNYEQIPDGFYDKIFDGPDGIRKFWHWHKFDSVVRSIEASTEKMSLLDIGCFSGSFSGRFLNENAFQSTSIDILPSQILYAQERYEKPDRKFIAYKDFQDARNLLRGQTFDVVTFIEVIEHLTQAQIADFFLLVNEVTHKGSQLIITTPNYFSLWPILEVILNLVSDVKYEEQHITKFNYWNFKTKLESIYPQLSSQFTLKLLTTSHLVTPYLPLVSYPFAQKVSRFFTPSAWASPLGSILIARLEKN